MFFFHSFPNAMAVQKFQYKIVDSLSSDPQEVEKAFKVSTGWGVLGPTGSRRCGEAFQHPVPGLSFFLTIHAMCSYKLTLVGHCPLGLTLVRLGKDKEMRMLVKPVITGSRTLTVELSPVEKSPKVFLTRCYNLNGEELLSVRLSKSTRWQHVLQYISDTLGYTSHDNVEFMCGATRLKKDIHGPKCLSEDLVSSPSKARVKKDHLKKK